MEFKYTRADLLNEGATKKYVDDAFEIYEIFKDIIIEIHGPPEQSCISFALKEKENGTKFAIIMTNRTGALWFWNEKNLKETLKQESFQYTTEDFQRIRQLVDLS